MEQRSEPGARGHMLRGGVIVLAVLELLQWLTYLPGLANETWTGYSPGAFLYMMFLLVVCPLLAVAGLILAVRGRRLRLAAMLVAIQPVAYAITVVAFAIGVAKYGF